MALTETDTGLVPPNGVHRNGDTAERQTPRGNRLDIWKPSTEGLVGYFDAEVLDPFGVEPPSVIKESTPWKFRFHVWLIGDIWKCVCGSLCYEVNFEGARDGNHLSLEDIVNQPLVQEFIGCEHFEPGDDGEPGRVHLTYDVDIRAGGLPAGHEKGTTYNWTADVIFMNQCGEAGVIAGFDKGCVKVYPHTEH